MTEHELLSQGIGELQSGQFDRAERSYRTILGKNPKHPDALNLLGMLLAQTGRAEEGIECMKRAIDVVPTFAPFHANLGETYRRQKKYDLAIASLKRAIELDPKLAEARNNLSAALADTKRWEESLAAAREALAIKPAFAGAEFNVANALQAQERHEEAIAAYRRALAMEPGFVDAMINLGSSYKKLLRFDEAIATFVQVVCLKPDSVDGYNNLAVVLDLRGRGAEALAVYQRALTLDSNNMRTLSNYGYALAKIGRLDEALPLCQRAVAQPNADGDAFAHLGFVYNERGELEEALACCRRAVELEPTLASTHNAMGTILKDMGKVAEAIPAYRRAAELSRTEPGFGSNLVYTLHFDTTCSVEQLFKEHRWWNERYGKPLARFIQPVKNDRDPEKRLRIGYVSPDFRLHPVGRFIATLLTHHDHQQFEIFCYASVRLPDALTERMRKSVDVWRDTNRLTNRELTEQIRADGIDILVDLTMHMADNRLTVFARKPAPVQVTYLAYAGTTGLTTIDYRITDPWLDPAGEREDIYTEKSVRISSYWCYEPPIEGLLLTPPPSVVAGYVTFGCLNNFCKVSPGALETWCRILGGMPGSRLLIHSKLGKHRDELLQKVAKWGIDPARIEFAGKLSLAEYMLEYARIDIGLDPFPYVGGTTTCDALWMGVPVITLGGTTAISRGGVSIMNNVGLPEMIADSSDEYVRLATELANDRERLIHLRGSLRETMRGSRLMDAKRFARDMEGAFRWMWREYAGTV